MTLNTSTIMGRQPGPRLLITAGVHGDEWEPMIAVRDLAALIRPEELAGQLMLVPIVNEPAYRLGQRVGEDGKDLARVCPGRGDGSPTERIAFELAELMRDADYYIDLHTGGLRLSIWPLAGYLVHSNSEVLESQRRMARAFGLPVIWGTDPTIQGRTLSVARDQSIPAIYVEYLGSATFCRDAVTAMVKGCRSVMAAIGMLAESSLPKAGWFFAEDVSPGSGYLQICHPAPAEGLFEPVVELGQRILAGAPLGYFTGDTSHVRVPIPAQSSGRVVSLHTMPRVAANEGLGVVVDLKEIGT